MNSHPIPGDWSAALGRIPSGLFILTFRHGNRETGMLASWVQQCSFEPPQVSVAVQKGRYILDWMAVGAAFAVNVVPEGEKKLIAHFGKGFDPGEPAFNGVDVARTDGGLIVLNAALAHLACTVAGRADAGDHTLIFSRVVGGKVHQDGKPAFHSRKNGLNY